jgi:hypothetical protein
VFNFEDDDDEELELEVSKLEVLVSGPAKLIERLVCGGIVLTLLSAKSKLNQ